MKTLHQKANSIARKFGHGRATKISYGDVAEPTIGETVRRGYVKNTTGQYVPHAYLAHFGWKNTHYVHAKCEVIFPISFACIAPEQI